MRSGLGAFVGRARERDDLRAGVAELRRGRGGLWLISGEPGIGKSRLVEEIAAEAERDGAVVAWGRCWEAGGAPAYWPWIQILRALRPADAPPGERPPLLAQLVAEPRKGAPASATSPERARFELLDAVWHRLAEQARRQPLLIVLEDLHAADASSLLLLDLVGHQVRTAPVAVLGTFRDSDAHRGEAGPLLLRIARQARAVPLLPLAPDDVATFLTEATGLAPAPSLAAQMAARTDGNPLFLVELTRLLIAHGASVATARAVPPTVRTAIGERLAGLSAPTRAVLERAAIVGRDVAPSTLVEDFSLADDDVAAAVDEAAAALLLVPVARDAYRFSHMLVRDVLYQGVADDQRAALHRRLADGLRRRHADGASAPWSEIAHHLLAAGPGARADAIDALERTAGRALEALAFEDAIAAYRLALDTVGDDPGARRATLLVGLGCACFHAGDADGGRAGCLRAAALARHLGDAEILADAALGLGATWRFARVDADLVALLEEAAAALPGADSARRARVLARLAAAKQPAREPAEPIALAQQAIAMARRVGDAPTLLAVLRAGTATLMDIAEPGERVDLNRELASLATRLGDRVQALHGHTRLAIDCFELRDLAGASAAIAAVERLAAELGHPSVRWRARAFAATRAMWEGNLDGAEVATAEARALGEASGDPNARGTAVYQRVRLLRLAGRDAELCAATSELRELFRGTPATEACAEVLAAAQLVAAGRRDAGLRQLAPDAIDAALALHDRTSIESLAEVAHAAADRSLASRLRERMSPCVDTFVSSGVVGLTWDGAMRRPLALVALTLGDLDAAVDHLAVGIAQVEAAGGAPIAAWMRDDLASALEARDAAGDRDRARAVGSQALAEASALGLAGVAARCRARLNRADRSAPAPGTSPPRATAPVATEPFSLVCEGEYWTVGHGGASFRLRDSRGLQLLARLVETPGRELHVLDLTASEPVDGGDAGDELDARARGSYRERIAVLERERAEAAAWNDLGRTEALDRELHALTTELARAFGLGGHARRSGAAAERARINVQRRLRDAIRRIGGHDERLARHLERSVRTGIFCCYDP